MMRSCYKKVNILRIEDFYTLKVAKLMHNFTLNRLTNSFSCFFSPINAIHTQTTILVPVNLNFYIFYCIELKNRKDSLSFRMLAFFKFRNTRYENAAFDSFKIQFKKYLIFNYHCYLEIIALTLN